MKGGGGGAELKEGVAGSKAGTCSDRKGPKERWLMVCDTSIVSQLKSWPSEAAWTCARERVGQTKAGKKRERKKGVGEKGRKGEERGGAGG